MKKRLLTLIFTLFVGTFSVFAQMSDPTSWTFSQQKTGDNEYALTFKATIQPGWTVYSMSTPEGGPMPTAFTIEKVGEGIELVGNAEESEPHKKHDDVFGVDVWYYTDSYTVTQKIKVTDPSITAVKGVLEFQACQEGACVPGEKDFTIELGGKSSDKAAVAAADDSKGATDETKSATEDDSLWLFFWMAFGSGLLAVVMPCVFPMIPMTVSFFMHGDSNKAKAKAKAVFFALSIVAIYTALGLIISFLLGPGFINWLSTNWLPNICFFIIFMIFAASFFGAFEIVLPSWIVNKSDAQADKGGYIGAFFMAFTLVLVSFSCTAPIVGTVLVEAARGSILRPIIGMLGFSIAVALPFGFFSFFPSKLSNLPKSGGWLNAVKVVLGFIEVALGFKFLMVADQTYHWGLLDREVYIAIWIAVFTLQALYLMGKIRFAHDSDLPYIGVPRLVMIIITLSFVVYLIPGMFGAPLKAFAGYLPPQETIDFDVNRIVRDNAKEIMKSGIQVGGVQGKATFDEPVKYSNILKPLPHGLDGYYDYDQALRAAQALDKPLFIDFTGHGCVNCREMEQSVWADPRVLEMLKNDYVIVALYVDDKTKLAEEEVYVSEYDGKKKNTIGKKNTDFQIGQFDSNAQPNYILLDSRKGNAKDLRPHVLQPARGYNKDSEAFAKFLQDGLKEYKNRANK